MKEAVIKCAEEGVMTVKLMAARLLDADEMVEPDSAANPGECWRNSHRFTRSTSYCRREAASRPANAA